MTREKMLHAALNCAREKTYKLMTREDIAAYADVAPSLVSHYLGSMEEIRDKVMARAIKIEDHIIVSHGIVFKHPLAVRTPSAVRHRIFIALQKEGIANV